MPGRNTRREIRSRPAQTHDDNALEQLLAAVDRRMKRLNDEYLRRMGEHIADIGTLWPSDVHRLQQLRRMNRSLRQLEARIASAAEMSAEEIEAVFRRVAEADVRMAAKILGVPDTINVRDNLPLQRILRAHARETAGRMANLSNTTVVSSYYRKAVDAACTAVQSGVEDYNTAIRRVIREAGAQGLRVREDGTRAVDYESGWSRRLDSAARMNVLDGMRHLNQSIMEEVGRQFGADGVEIDAHMLCAEDHLPYQGQQFSNEDFEQIQDSLDRPFGEWNCRHSWHPIMLGISPPAWTPEQLEEMRRFSTELVTVDGRTKTRYKWSQEMRRIETAVRQQKDTANLARVTGDDTLRRRCQGNILELNKYYKELSEKVGLQPEFQRTYVAGFRDVSEKALTGKNGSGIMASDSGEIWHPITPESLYAIPQFTEFSTSEANEAVHKACTEILNDLIRDMVGTEETITLPISQLNSYLRGELVMDGLKRKGEQGDGSVLPILIREPFISIHNHPSNGTVSFEDIHPYWKEDNFIGLVVVGNNGSNTYTLLKTDKYDFVGFAKYCVGQKHGLTKYRNEEEFMKGVEKHGVRYVKR